MKTYLSYHPEMFPPLLKMFVHGCPHYRQDRATFQAFRKTINLAATNADILYPIDEPIDLYVIFVNPTSPDIANCIMALYRALDGKALKGKSLLTDDGLITKITAIKYYPNDKTKCENRVP